MQIPEQPHLFRFRTNQPKGIEQMIMFAEFAMRTHLVVNDTDTSPYILDAFFVFSEHYDGGLDVLPPNVKTHDEGSVFLECFAEFARKINAHGTITITPFNQLRAAGPLMDVPNREDLVFVMAQTHDGDESVGFYELKRDDAGLIENVEPYEINGSCKVSTVFALRPVPGMRKSQQVRDYADKLIASFPPDRPLQTVH